jgi:hypothetical protein
MKKYFTWRCIGLHALVVVLVPAFLLAGWWQYHVALSGNTLSWMYTVEWPFFALYAVYVWWKLIHDSSTPFDRLWAARQRVAAAEDGRPLNEIPGWAMDKELTRDVYQASLSAVAGNAILAGTRPAALDMHAGNSTGVAPMEPLVVDLPEPAAIAPIALGDAQQDQEDSLGPVVAAGSPDAEVIDVHVPDMDVKVVANEELDAYHAYNRYLSELSTSGPPKRWSSRRRKSRGDGADPGGHDPANARPPAPQIRALPSGNHQADGSTPSAL